MKSIVGENKALLETLKTNPIAKIDIREKRWKEMKSSSENGRPETTLRVLIFI